MNASDIAIRVLGVLIGTLIYVYLKERDRSKMLLELLKEEREETSRLVNKYEPYIDDGIN